MNAKNLSKQERGGEDSLQETKEGKLGKYLTEMKELPPRVPDEQKQTAGEKVHAVSDTPKEMGKNLSMKDNDSKVPPQAKVGLPNSTSEKLEAPGLSEVPKGRRLPITSKDLILGAVNLISVILLVIILFRFPGRSKELRDLKIQNIRDNSNINLGFGEVEANKPRASEIEKYFLDEGGVVDFINNVENQEVEGGASIKVTFASQNTVKDRTGNFGVPIVIELIGSWEEIDANLQKIDKLPYLFRPANVEIAYSEEGPLVVVFKYGVFLYVRESLGQNR